MHNNEQEMGEMVLAPLRLRVEDEDNREAPSPLHTRFEQGRRDLTMVEARDPDFIPADSSFESRSSACSSIHAHQRGLFINPLQPSPPGRGRGLRRPSRVAAV